MLQSQRGFRFDLAFLRLLAALAAMPMIVSGQAVATGAMAAHSTTIGEWPSYAGDVRGTRYSPQDQINAANFNSLEVAWRFKTDYLGPRPEYKLEGTPLMVGGVLYATAGTRRAIVALDAGTGELLWAHGEHEGARGAAAPRQLSGRGLAYWTDGKNARIIYVTAGYRLIALDAKTGTLVPGFGKNGAVDLKLDDDQTMLPDLTTGEIGLHAAPVVANDVVIVGAAFREGATPKSYKNNKGFVRGFDVRTGKRLWIFHTIPMKGEFGYDTWLNGSAEYTGNTGVWTQISVDEELGLAYLPVESPTGDYYGGHRPGNNLYGESVVCVDLKTGKPKWYYQVVHHPLWDFDLSSQPILGDINVNGRAIKAVALPSKQGILYVFDRVTGKPVWPIEERPVVKGDVPGEWYAATQPFPTKPPFYSRNGISIDDLIDFTPELRAEAVKAVARFKIGPIFTPPSLSTVDGTIGTLTIGTGNGGTNWPGGSYDPETHIVYASASNMSLSPLGLIPPPSKDLSDMNFFVGVAGERVRIRTGSGEGGGADSKTAAPPPYFGGGGPTIQGLPLLKPPYGTITAISLDKGEIVWQIPHGETPDVVRESPLLKGMNIPRTGQPDQSVGTLVTKTLLIAGDPEFTTTPTRPRGAMLRAYDKATGKEVGAVFIPAPQSGSPMTYLLNGRQYVVVAVSGGPFSGEYIAFSLPTNQ